MAQSTEALSVVDAAWLRMDRPTNLMMICGMMMLDGRVGLDRLKQLVHTRMLCFHRFRQRVAGRDASPRWEFDPGFDLDWHVRRLAVPAEPGALEAIVGDLVSTALDPSKPMWQFHLLDGPGTNALLVRIHHCYGDGFALLHVIDAILDIDPAHPRAGATDLAPGPPRSAWERILGPVTENLGDALRASLALAGTATSLLAHPARALDLAAGGADLVRQAAIIANMAPDAPTRLKGELGVIKRVAWAEPLALSEVKALAAAFACSVNDVLVACVAGALRGWLLEMGDRLAEQEIRALVPVNLRPPGPVTELGNRFGLVFLDLPVGIADPIERLEEVHRRMDELKHSQQPLVALGILAGMGVAPEFVKERVLEALAANASIVITNVRGTDEPRYLAGTRIASEMFWVPQSGGIGLGASILSYAGQVSFGVVADTRRVPDPAAIPERFTAEFETMLLGALLMPWPGEHGAPAGQRPGRSRGPRVS